MTLASKLISLFPLSQIVLIVINIYFLILKPNFLNFGLLIFSIYLYPVTIFRLINAFKPIHEGKSILSKKEYSPWWGSHQMQLLYYSIPQFESVLRLIPGAYSFWLRLWGSKVGKNVYWTPNVEIDDRTMMDIGNDVIIGHKSEFIGHVVGPKDGEISLYSKKITIEDQALIGGGSRLGPGAHIEKQAVLPVLSHIYIDEYIPKNHDLKFKPHRYPVKKKADYEHS